MTASSGADFAGATGAWAMASINANFPMRPGEYMVRPPYFPHRCVTTSLGRRRTGLCWRPIGWQVVTLTRLVDLRSSRKARAGVLSVALHVLLVLVILAGGRHDGLQAGDALISMPLMTEELVADLGNVEERVKPEPAAPTPPSDAQLDAAIAKLAPAPSESVIPALADFAPPELAPVPLEDLYAIRTAAVPETRAMSAAEKAELSRRL